MAPQVSLLSDADDCPYLPDRMAQVRYEVDLALTPSEYLTRIRDGWRRFGPIMFRHECPTCSRCQSIRVFVQTFHQSESQRRVWTRNDGEVEVRIASPSSSPEKLDLFRRFHRHGHAMKGWDFDPEQDLSLFVRNPFPTEEWSYYVGEKLLGVGYVDVLIEGLSAIYFFHDPDEGRRSLGTFNILKMIEVARERTLPHLYLGYYVEGCRSLEYKARFGPNEILSEAGDWDGGPT